MRRQYKLGGFIPREWLVKAMQHWAKEVCKIKREKNIEIKILKDEISSLQLKLKEFNR